MNTNVHTAFIKKYWFNVIKTENGYCIFNTQRRRNQIDRDGIGYVMPDSECQTKEEAIKLLEWYEKNDYDFDK